jgi:hypothetical protein
LVADEQTNIYNRLLFLHNTHYGHRLYSIQTQKETKLYLESQPIEGYKAFGYFYAKNEVDAGREPSFGGVVVLDLFD